MIIKFLELTLHNFKAIRDLHITYTDVLKLTGQNGESKTSIGEAPVWCLYGVDLMNSSKFDPTPTNYEFDTVSAELLLSKDGAEYLLKREIANGKNVFYKNEVPITATEYKAFVDSLFEKEMFLSLYNPSFFFDQKWEDQRKQIMKYVSAPLNAQIFDAMSIVKGQPNADWNPYARRLEAELKKETIPNLQAKHTKNKNDKDKLYTQAQGSVKTITEQIKAFKDVPDVDLAAKALELDQIDKDIAVIQETIKNAKPTNDAYARAEKGIADIEKTIAEQTKQIEFNKLRFPAIKAAEVKTECASCLREYDKLSNQVALGDLIVAEMDFRTGHKALLDERELTRASHLVAQEALEELPWIEVTVEYEKINALQASKEPINESIRKQKDKDSLSGQLEAAKKLESEHLASNKDSIFVLDAIKSFNATEASLQVSKVEELFTRLKVRLFNYIESTGEYKPFFMIQMDGKDYNYLSLGESVTAGLELHEVLHKQSSLIVPCFLDNIESYTGNPKVYGQSIISRVVEGQALQINGQDVK